MSSAAASTSTATPLFAGVALVTGAASGIGRQVAISFAREGCRRVALLDKDEDGMTETGKLMRKASALARSFIIPCDVKSEQEIKVSIDCVIEEWGRIDYAVNCAGIFGPVAPSHLLNAAEFDRVNSINYRGVWLSAREELKRMMQQEALPTHDGRPGSRGAIVNVASNLALVSRNETPAYSASKAAVVSLTKSDAVDYAKYNIRINCVCPGIINTPMTKDMSPDDPLIAVAPMARMGTPQEVADAVLFLCSPKASFIHGAALSVDGGYVIN